MSARLQPLNLLDFTGGLNLRLTDFMLADNESPGMLNINMDTRGGIVTRAGWAGWNPNDVVPAPTHANWKPRNAEMHLYSTGAFAVFVTNGNKVWTCQQGQNFVDMGITATATPHLADIASWGDTVYLATGRSNQAARVVGPPAAGNLASLLTKAAASNFNNNYTTPLKNVFPACEFAEAHGGYMFAANIIEDEGAPNGVVTHPNRVRWSHPDQPEDWAKDDFIEILQGGSRITGLKSFRDHLLIFKVDSVWALYGYDRNSWQLIKVSQSIGSPGIQAVTKSDTAVYFYSASSRNGIYAYQGSDPLLISEPIKRAMDSIVTDSDVWLGWQNKRLLCSIPYDPDPDTETPPVAAPEEYVTYNESNHDSTGDFTKGMKFRFAIAGNVVGVRLWIGTGVANAPNIKVGLWTAAGVKLADVVAPPLSSGWTSVYFTTPVAVAANTTYVASVYFPLAPGQPVRAIFNGWTAGITSGNVRALSDGEDGQQGFYASGDNFPNTYWSGNTPVLSAVFQAPPVAGLGASHGSIMLFDPEVGQGAWIRYKPAKGTIACVVERSDVGTELPMLVTCGCTGYAGILRGMAAPTLAGDVFKPGTPMVGFRNYYRTSWKHAGWPELQKSWLRPRIVARRPPQPVVIRLNTFWNYDAGVAKRSHTFLSDMSGVVFWRDDGAADPGGANWGPAPGSGPTPGTGALWGAGLGVIGDTIVRPIAPDTTARSLGWARAVMLEFSPEDYTLGLAWAIDAVVLKYNVRRFTT